jgi:precorrin-6B methylase 2/transposase-like protein
VSAADLRRALERRYRYDETRRVFRPQHDRSFTYSDGAASEAYLAAVIESASDLRVGSAELARAIRDWPSQYHLSPARPNLLRPLAGALGQRVLEVGAGCGAITRFLGESGATVLAIEGSIDRAVIAASRCRDLANVFVVCDNFENVDVPFAFDLVTLIGVLEYSRMFVGGDDPVQTMLRLAKARLSDNGSLALAIENQLGLKYLAGAPEDHAGEPFFGIADLYGPRTPVTFGRRELQQRVERAGFSAIECFYAFPDYKLPAVIVTEDGFLRPDFGVADLVATSNVRRVGGEVPHAFSESLARDVFVRNGLGPATANSFLFLAGRSTLSLPRAPDQTILAYAYSTGRDRCYAKETRFVSGPKGLIVLRRQLFDMPPGEDRAIRQNHVAEEPYVMGESVYRGLERIVARRGWTIDALAEWADPWLRLLRDLAHGPERRPAETTGDETPIDPTLFDCTPFNIVRRTGDGKLVPFDLEWEAVGRGDLTLSEVAFRGLWNCLLRLEEVSPPAEDVPKDIASIVTATLERLKLRTSPAQTLEWIRNECAFTGVVSGCGHEEAPVLPRIRIRGEGAELSALRVALVERELEVNRSRLLQSLRQASREVEQNAKLSARIAELETALRLQQSELERLDRILGQVGHRFVSRIGAMLEPHPRMRAILRMPLNVLHRLFRNRSA